MTHERKPAYWAVIPARVRYDEDLRPNAKLLYAEIQALADKSGYCWATNEYLAKLYGLAARTVSDLVSKLAQKGYIGVEVLRDEETNEVIERRLWVDKPYGLEDLPPAKNSGRPHAENGGTPPAKNSDTPPAKNGEENIKKKLNNIPPKAPQRGRRAKSTPRKAPDWKPERFAGFWDFYPRGENKQRAMDAWDKLKPSDELMDSIAKALVALKASEDWKRGIGIPHASTFLNGARWTDAEKLLPAQEAPLGGWEDPEVIP